MPEKKKKKRLFAYDVIGVNDAAFEFEEGDTVYEVVVVGKFKAKFDANRKLIIPEAK